MARHDKTDGGLGLREHLLAPPRETLIGYFSERLARAMREEVYVDPQGRTVRLKHAAPVKLHGEQMMLWDDIRTASPQHMRNALQLRRRQIVGDCRQLQVDAASYNDNTNTGRPIQVEFDFRQDLAELDVIEQLRRERRQAKSQTTIKITLEAVPA